MKDSIVWCPPPQKKNFMICPLKKATGLAVKQLKREIGRGSNVVWDLDKTRRKWNQQPVIFGRYSYKQYLPFYYQIVFHIQEVIASVPANDELGLEFMTISHLTFTSLKQTPFPVWVFVVLSEVFKIWVVSMQSHSVKSHWAFPL